MGRFTCYVPVCQLSYYNPLIGGGPAATRTLLIGWGEGLEHAGAYIRELPDRNCDQFVLSWYDRLMNYYVCNKVVSFYDTGYSHTNIAYAIFYINQVQRGINPVAMPFWEYTTPVYTVSIHGIDYAYVYKVE